MKREKSMKKTQDEKKTFNQFTRLILISQFSDQTDAENHDEESDCNDNQKYEAEPTQHHGWSADSALDTAVTHVLCDGTCCDRRRVLP